MSIINSSGNIREEKTNLDQSQTEQIASLCRQ